MIPPMMSSTIGSEDIQNLGKKNQSGQSGNQNTSEGQTGRPAKEETELSDKTIANRESQS